MWKLLNALRQDEHGVILSAEIVIVGTVLVIGLMTGLACLQKSVNSELGDFAKAIDSIDQSYSFSGHRKTGGYYGAGAGNCCAFTAGSAFRNNERNTNVCHNDIVGCEGQMLLHSECGGTCDSCGGQCGVGGVCGSCGLSGAAAWGDAIRPYSVDTGVPNMKVTEYPGTSNVPRTSNEGRSALRFPQLEGQPNVHQFGPPIGPGFEQDSYPGHHDYRQGMDQSEPFIQGRKPLPHGPIHRHSPLERRSNDAEVHPGGAFHQPSPRRPRQRNVPDSTDSNEPLRPVPQDQPLPFRRAED